MVNRSDITLGVIKPEYHIVTSCCSNHLASLIRSLQEQDTQQSTQQGRTQRTPTPTHKHTEGTAVSSSKNCNT
jgi:hypothetical protein